MGSIIVSLFILLLIVAGAGLYFLPSILALVKKKDNFLSILLLNLFLGWSLIGWVVSLVWATTKDSQPQQVIIQNRNGGPDETKDRIEND